MQCISRINIFIPVFGARKETCYYRVKASKTGLFRKQVLVCVQVLVELPVPWVPEPTNNKKKKIRKERKLALVKW